MTITLETIQTLAPDQASLIAAKKLLSPRKWQGKSRAEALIWGDCQGSGANPYHAVFDLNNHGSKCTCPSRKFPCKHVLALAWQFVDDEAAFSEAECPPWVLEWQSRRRSTSTTPPDHRSSKRKNILKAANAADTVEPVDEKKQAAASARAAKTKAATDAAVSAGLQELQLWLNDRLRLGLAHFLSNAEAECKRIRERMVDAKASALASRIDELPAKLADRPSEIQLRQTINEFGKWVWLIRAWQKNSDSPDVRRALISAESCEAVLENPASPCVKGVWKVIAEQITTRRDNLISHATWLYCLNDDAPHRFALLQDYCHPSSGKYEKSHIIGACYDAEMVFYPSQYPLRAVMASRENAPEQPFPAMPDSDINHLYGAYQRALATLPWLEEMPYLLPAGRVIRTIDQGDWWQAEGGDWQVPLVMPKRDRSHYFDLLSLSRLQRTFILWDGVYGNFGSGDSPDWGMLCQ